ncbi:MAG: nucleotide exchange factor GrpE [Gammaproteobacteria bacterium]
MARGNKTRAASAPPGDAAPAAAATANEDAHFHDARGGGGGGNGAQGGENQPETPETPETNARQEAEAGAHEQPETSATDASATEPDATETGTTETSATESDTTESSTTDADATEPGATESDLAALPPETLIAKLQQAQTENAGARDGLLRARAEIENIRRRSQNEIVAARKFAIEDFARELLGVRDSLERAAAVVLEAGAAAPVVQMNEGLGLTLKQFDRALARFAVVEVAAAPGTRFDPECHQAISTAASAEFAPDHIVTVVQPGFLLKERLLRPAMVVVAQKA